MKKMPNKRTALREDECQCGHLARMAENPKDPVQFDRRLNEYHIMRQGNGGYSVIYFCPFCGGRAPNSQRSSLFHRLTEEERHRLTELTGTCGPCRKW